MSILDQCLTRVRHAPLPDKEPRESVGKSREGKPHVGISGDEVRQLRDLLKAAQEKGEDMASSRVKGQKTEDEKVKDALLKTLSDLGGMVVGDDDLVFEGTRFVIPESMEGNLSGAIRYLQQQQEQAEEPFSFDRKYNYRPFDGAHAFECAMRKMWGTSGIGKAIETMWGKIPPAYITVNVSAKETKQIPWGRVAFSPLSADFYVGATTDREYGQVFHLEVRAPRKYRRHIEAFFMLVERELKENSIYRGKAFTGAEEPVFLDLSNVNPDKVIYSDDVMVQLETNMWSVLRYTDNLRKFDQKIKRAVLLEGPYGTGKSLAGELTAREAVQNGWTFIQARPGKDDLAQVLGTAQLYAPSVVWYEDIDAVAHSDNLTPISALLESLDGISNKGVEILAGFTTNFVERIHAAVLRPGRLDAVIHVGMPTKEVYARLVRANIPEELRGDIDYAKVAEAMEGYVPAFASEAIGRAMCYRMSRNGGVPGIIETEDLVNAAHGLRPQWTLQQSAGEGAKLPTVDAALTELVTGKVAEVVNATGVVDLSGDPYWRLAINGANQ